MKKILLATMVLGSTVAISACSTGFGASDTLDETLTQAPYAEERTVGSVPAAVVRSAPAAAVRSAAPVFQAQQVK